MEEEFIVKFIDECIINNATSVSKICQKAKDEIQLINNKLLELNNLRELKKKYKNVLKVLDYKETSEKFNSKFHYQNINQFLLYDEDLSNKILNLVTSNNNCLTVDDISKELLIEPIKQVWFTKVIQTLMIEEKIVKDTKTKLIRVA